MFLSPQIPMHITPEVAGEKCDFKLFSDDKWLMNTEVVYRLQKSKGMWCLTMIYIAIENPLKFICKEIDTYPSEKKAIIYAKILQRGIRKDARGTLKTNRDAFNFCNN